MKGPITYIKEAWGIYTKKENFVFFARVMAVLVIASTVLSFLIGYFYPAEYSRNIDFSNAPAVVGFVILSVIGAFVSLWTQSTVYFSILKMGNPEKEVFQLGYKNIWRYLLTSLVLGLIIVGGVILLVIPAVIFGIWFSFTIFLVLDKNLRVGEALRTSKSMVKGKFWQVLGRNLVFGLFTAIASLILTAVPYLGSMAATFMVPLFTLPGYLLYKDLLLGKED